MPGDPKYQIQKLVAKGGTAVLYSAVQTSLDRVVAVKKLHQHLTEDENFTRRFVLEAKAAASLDHENIVKIIDFGTENDGYHMVMEFIEGESVRGILDRWKQLPIDLALAIVYRVCQGLEHAHAKGIVHRDIKPGNVMVTRSGRVKITDFGLAKLTQQTTQHTAANSILGTPLYMSPEQAFGESVDQRSDLFSLGTMLYEMITGVQPFRDEHYMGVIQNIIKRNAPHPSKFNMELPQPVQSLLAKAMTKSREARFQSAGDFKKAIEKYLGLRALKESDESLRQLLNNDGETVILPTTLARQTRQRSLHRGFLVGVVAAVILGGAGLAYTLQPERFAEKARKVAAWVGLGAPRNAPTAVMEASSDGLPELSAVERLVTDTLATRQPADTTIAEVATPVLAKPETLAAAADTAPVPPTPVATAKTPIEATPPPAAAEQETKTMEAPQEIVVRRGWLSVTAEPSAEVWVDGELRGMSPPTLNLELPRGPHRVEVRKDGYEDYSETVYITAGELSSRKVFLKKPRGYLTISTTPGAEVLVDGSFVGVTPLGKAIHLDVGNHQVTVKKAGYNAWNNQITIRADETLPLSIVLSPLY